MPGNYLLKPYELNKENIIITFRSYARIMLRSCPGLTLGSYIIKPCKWHKKNSFHLRLGVVSIPRKVVSCIFSCRTMYNFYKLLSYLSYVMKNIRIDRISKIVSRLHDIFGENYTIFFQIQEKLKTCRNSNLTNFRRSSFGIDLNVTFIS